MEYRPPVVFATLPEGPAAALRALRTLRAFDPGAWWEAKRRALHTYLHAWHLTGAVVGVSGGIDSALVAALAVACTRDTDAALTHVTLVHCPAPGARGCAGQEAAEEASDVLDAFLETPVLKVPVTKAAHAIQDTLDAQGIPVTPWTAGQGLAIQRTMVLYQVAAWRQSQGDACCVWGTTNRDEGSIAGYVGKAADGMVDLQPLADLHKSEVYALAAFLDLPLDIRTRAPVGDLFDGATDLDVLGMSYDVLELEALRQDILDPLMWNTWQDSWSQTDRVWWKACMEHRTQHCRRHAHKYHVGQPAVFFDLLPRAVPGGWSPELIRPWSPPSTFHPSWAAPRGTPSGERLGWVTSSHGPLGPLLQPPCLTHVAAHHFTPSPSALNTLLALDIFQAPQPWLQDDQGVWGHIPGVVTEAGLTRLQEHLFMGTWWPADRHGQWQPAGAMVWPLPPHAGSWRTSWWDPAFAEVLWRVLAPLLPSWVTGTDSLRRCGIDEETGRAVWRPACVSPLFRAIAYTASGALVPHYDATYREHAASDHATLYSLVLVLQSARVGGQLTWVPERLLPEGPAALRDVSLLPTPTRNTSFSSYTLDRWRDGEEIVTNGVMPVSARAGDLLWWNHRRYHQSLPVQEGCKVILRTDIVGRRVGGGGP